MGLPYMPISWGGFGGQWGGIYTWAGRGVFSERWTRTVPAAFAREPRTTAPSSRSHTTGGQVVRGETS